MWSSLGDNNLNDGIGGTMLDIRIEDLWISGVDNKM